MRSTFNPLKKYWISSTIAIAAMFVAGCEPDDLVDWLHDIHMPDDNHNGWGSDTAADTDDSSGTACEESEMAFLIAIFEACENTVVICFDSEGQIYQSATPATDPDGPDPCLVDGLGIVEASSFPCHADECVTIAASGDINTDTDWDMDTDTEAGCVDFSLCI